ncbi:hypothetical protein VQ042_14520 [Aurantimonas sp. A2-1-M11]|uniref:hypothetical protein n=1 Tax=Aurantimonas sp. A2-1-M11 TaxID=3113712 RepID=UPI002F95B2A2
MSALPLTDSSLPHIAAPARVLAFPGGDCPTVRPATPQLTDDECDELNRLRWFALKSRLAPKPDLERACFLLAGESNVSLERFAIAFFRGLSARSLREMVFYRPGARHASDDEIWLLRLLSVLRSGENAAAGALVAWRVRPDGRRWLRFLAASLANAL